MAKSPAHLPPAASLIPLGRTVRSLRVQIEAATGGRFAAPGPGAVPVIWMGNGPGSVLSGRRLRCITVEPGPLLSPYDGPQSGFASLRLTYEGRPCGGTEVGSDFAQALRESRLVGRNRFPIGSTPAIEAACAGPMPPTFLYVDPDVGRSSRRLRDLVLQALRGRPDERIVAAGPAGCRPPKAPISPRLVVIPEPVDPWILFERAARTLAASHEAVCQARLAGAAVDRLGFEDDPRSADDQAASVDGVFGKGVHYFDPWTGAPIPPEAAIERVAWLSDRFVANTRRIVLVGISRWKRPAIDVFADGPRGPPIHTMTAEDAVGAAKAHRGEVQAWATRMPAKLPDLCAASELPFSRIEDGFLRSVGLGASLKPGASIVVDDRSIYYDPRIDSRLTLILRETAFAPDLKRRAAALRQAIVERRLSKYNVGLPSMPSDWPTGTRIVLVPGQVEDDASVRYGSARVRTNLDLLRAARARNPDAFLLYKPHPDVEAGFRPGLIPEAVVLGLADRVVGGLSIVDLLDRVHHVETMTSLTGFEALLRGPTVATHGKPFYAGWGLTEDLAPDAWRGRALDVDELVAGTLILYARYIDPIAMKPCEPEFLLERLSAARTAGAPSPLSIGTLAHLTMRARYAVLTPLVRLLRARRGVEPSDDDRR